MMQKELLVGLRRGETWSRYRATREFHLAKPQDIDLAITDLLNRGLIKESDGVFALFTNEKSVTLPAPNQPTAPIAPSKPTPTGAVEIRSLGPNTEMVVQASTHGRQSVSEIKKATDLSENQIRYAIKQLLEAHVLVMVGGRGVRGTRYHLSSRPEN